MKFILILILTIPYVSFAGNDSIRNYYDYINKAELSICKNKLGKASIYYSKAFSYKTNPFACDLNNALKCELLSNQNKLNVLNYLSLLKKKNLIVTIPDSIMKCDSQWESIQKQVDSIKPFVNQLLQSSFDSLQLLDQAARHNCPGYKSSCVKTVIFQDSLNYIKLKNLYRQFSSLNEESVGYNFNQRTWLFQVHYGMWQWQWFNMETCLFNEVKKGNIDARVYANIIDRNDESKGSKNRTLLTKEYGAHYGTELMEVLNNYLVIPLFNGKSKYVNNKKSRLREINYNRHLIYLESYSDLIKKAEYVYFSKPCWNEKLLKNMHLPIVTDEGYDPMNLKSYSKILYNEHFNCH